MYIKVPIVKRLKDCDLDIFIAALKKKLNTSNRVYLDNNNPYIYNFNENLIDLCGLIDIIDCDKLLATIEIIDTPSGNIVSKIVNMCDNKKLDYEDIDIMYEDVIYVENLYLFPLCLEDHNRNKVDNIFISKFELRYKK